MLTVRVRRFAFDVRSDEVHQIDWRGQSVSELVRQHWREEWDADSKIAVLVNGERISVDQLSEPLADQREVLIGPDPQGIDPLTYFAISLAVSAIVGWVYSRLVGGQPPIPEPERGDVSSAVYAWDQISSEYRAGFPVPYVFGEHDVGGQVIYMDVTPPSAASGQSEFEVLKVILGLGEGPIDSVGLVAGNLAGEADYMGGFFGQQGPAGQLIPRDIRVSGNRFDHTVGLPGLRAYYRSGRVDQSPLPAGVFPGASQVDVISQELRDANQRVQHTITDPELKPEISLILSFPAGLFSTDANGNRIGVASGAPAGSGLSATGVYFQLEWRSGPTLAWLTLGAFVVDAAPTGTPFARKISFDLSPYGNGLPGVAGNVELRLTRFTNAPNVNGQSERDVSNCIWRQVTYRYDQEFSYPRTALLGLEVQASEQIVSGRPNFVIRARGMKVRVWDSAINSGAPSSGLYWNTPASGDPYYGIWSYPPGRNPAWVLAHFLTHALDAWITDADIDWPAFRDWADFCDQDVPVNSINEAAFCFDGVLDSPQAAWDYVTRICRAGRAVPVIRGRLISIKYAYASAHGRGSNSVPAKTRVALLSSSNLGGFSITYTANHQRPAVIQMQFLDADQDYAQTVVPVDDPLGGHEDPEELNPINYQKETIELFGITRKSQAVREGLMMHGANRAIASEVSFQCGPDQLAAEIGDVIGIQHDVFRPNGSASFSSRAVGVGTTSVSLILDRKVTIGASTYVVFRDSSDVMQEVQIVSAPGTYQAGDTLTLASAQSWRDAAPFAIGEQSNVVGDYEITAATLDQNLVRRIVATRWQPSIHTLTDVGALINDAPGRSFLSSEFNGESDGSAERVINIRITPASTPGQHSIGWETAYGYEGRRVRVYARPEGSASWWVVGEYAAPPCTFQFTPGERYEVAVSIASRLGVYQLPDIATRTSFEAQEFEGNPPSNLHDASAEFVDGGTALRLSWQALASENADGIEVRKGPRLNGSQLLALVEGDTFTTDRIETYAVGDTQTYWLRVRSVNGLYSARPKKITVTSALPSDWVEVQDEIVDLSACVNSNLTTAQDLLTLRWNAQITSGYRGSIESPVYTLYDLEAWTWIHLSSRWSEDVTISEVGDIRLGDGESYWRLLDGRPASIYQRGMNPTETIGSFAGVPIASITPDRKVGGYDGQPGVHAAALVYYRVASEADVGSIGSVAWTRYTGPFKSEFAAIQLRVVLLRNREDLFTEFSDLRLRRFV